MKTLSHPNILDVYLVDKVEGEGCRVYFEQYLGVLSDLLNEIPLINTKTGVAPSVPFQDIVSDVVDGFIYLIDNDQYHGNFAWDTTFYANPGTKRIVKLANFERRSRSLLLCQLADCVSLGYALAEISERLQQSYPAYTCCLIDDLSDRLISATAGTFKAVMRDIKNCVFFWDGRRKKTFFAVEVPANWHRLAFRESFVHSESVPAMPWTNERYSGYMDAMEAYQDENNIDRYDDNNLSHFLQCISGMYTHQTELAIAVFIMSVDSAVHFAHPRLCLDLKVAVDQPDQPVDAVDQPDQPVVVVDQPDQPVVAVDQPDQPVVAVDQPDQPVVPVVQPDQPVVPVVQPDQ